MLVVAEGSKGEGVRPPTAIATMAAAAAETDEQYRQFVSRYLNGLSDALNLHHGPRATGVKRNLQALADSDTITTSQKVVNARMALGADDALYLQSGLGLLWAGDPTHDVEHQLFPSSLGSSGLGDSTRRALKGGLASGIQRDMARLTTALVARLPALVYLLSVPEIGSYVRADLADARLLTNAPGSLAVLIERLITVPANERHLTRNAGGVAEWIDRIAADDDPEYLEELITACASLHGLYVRTDSDPSAASPMELADLYTSAAVDVALARDWNTAEAVLRGVRADRAYRNAPAGAPVAPPAPGGAPPPSRGAASRPPVVAARPRGAPVARPGLGASLPERTVPVGAGAADDDGEGTEMAVAVAPRKRRARGWMQGMLGAETGAHSFGTGGSLLAHPAVVPGVTHGNEHHRVELTQQQRELGAVAVFIAGAALREEFAQGLGRVRDIVLKPLGGMLALSASIAASPLWDDDMLRAARVAMARYDNAIDGNAGIDNTTDGLLDAAFGGRLVPTFVEMNGLTTPDGLTVLYSRATADGVVRSLYDDTLGTSRSVPLEVNEWLEKASYVANFDVGAAGAVNPLTNGSQLGAVPVPGPDPDVFSNRQVRGASAASTMRAYDEFAGSTQRFVSYAMQRGLVADHGPHEQAFLRPDARLNYTRGTAQAIDKLGVAPTPLDAQSVAAPSATPRVPGALLTRWRTRDTTPYRPGYPMDGTAVGVLRNHLRGMVQMVGPVEPEIRAAGVPTSEMEVSPWLSEVLRLRDAQSQALANTQRQVRWAPISNGAVNLPVVSYGAGASAGCAVATYEHLVENLNEQDEADARAAAAAPPPAVPDVVLRTEVNAVLRPSLRACLKLRQLPHMVVFDGLYADAVLTGGAAAGTEAMQRVMRGNRDRLPVPIYEYRTLLPTEREFGNHVVEIVPPAFSGVWKTDLRAHPQWQQSLEQLNAANPNQRRTVDVLSRFRERGALGRDADVLGVDNGFLTAVAQSSPYYVTELALAKLRAQSNQPASILAPPWGLEVPHLPLGLPFNDRKANARLMVARDRTNSGEPNSLSSLAAANPAPSPLAMLERRGVGVAEEDEETQTNRLTTAANLGLADISATFRLAPPPLTPSDAYTAAGIGADRVASAAYTARPTWLTTTASVDGLIEECFRLTTRMHELGRQAEALEDPDDDAQPESLPGFLERERRGAIWEDALREMSISQDKLYNFLRTMSGSLHEDINAVVEVEASFVIQTTATPT